MIRKTYRFTLLEIVIATSLFAILIFSTTSLFFRYQKLRVRLDDIRPKVFERTLFFEKIKEMSATIINDTIELKSPHYEEFLSFTYDNSTRDRAEYSGSMKCKLYRTFDKELICKLTTSSGKEIKRCLLTDISSFQAKNEDSLLHLNLKRLDGADFSYTLELESFGEEKKK